jgi:hypothetical protein
MPGAAQKMRQLSAHHPMPSAAGRRRGGGAPDETASADGTIVDSGSCMTACLHVSHAPPLGAGGNAQAAAFVEQSLICLCRPPRFDQLQLWRRAR